MHKKTAPLFVHYGCSPHDWGAPALLSGISAFDLSLRVNLYLSALRKYLYLCMNKMWLCISLLKTQMTYNDRLRLDTLIRAGHKPKEVAVILHKHISTIYRELKFPRHNHIFSRFCFPFVLIFSNILDINTLNAINCVKGQQLRC